MESVFVDTGAWDAILSYRAYAAVNDGLSPFRPFVRAAAALVADFV